MLENTEGSIKNGQSREIGNIGYIRRKKKQKHNKKGTTFKKEQFDFNRALEPREGNQLKQEFRQPHLVW